MDSDRLGNIYRSIDIWKRKNGRYAIRYRCLELIGQNEFCVQSCDYYYYPVDENQIIQSDKQFIDLFVEIAPEDRTKFYPSLDEAIYAHENEFTDLQDEC